jgi:predicted O-methyltransferase YrrM
MSTTAPIPRFTLTQKIKLLLLGINNWNIPTYTTNIELLKLYDLAKTLKSKNIALEIGSYIGASSLMIAKGLKSGSTLYCIDTWQNDAMTEGNWDSFSEFIKNTKSVEHIINPIRRTSIEAVKNFNLPIDYLFIDGDHSYEGVKLDVEAWFPKLKSGGIIVMHDIGWAEGVNKVIADNIEPYLSKFEKLPNMYWGWKK